MIDADREYIASCLKRISDGEDSDAVFELKRGRGQKKQNDESLKTLSFLLHLVATHVTEGVAIEHACSVVSEVAQRRPDGPAYDADYLRQCWHRYPHMQSPERSQWDDDLPYKA